MKIVDSYCWYHTSGHAYSTIIENAKVKSWQVAKTFVAPDHAPEMPVLPTTGFSTIKEFCPGFNTMLESFREWKQISPTLKET
ncbi:hypothetical protein OH492_12245 [Vibrio chagasii]|nr:hypothetical protein [Vibrio chagasii]